MSASGLLLMIPIQVAPFGEERLLNYFTLNIVHMKTSLILLIAIICNTTLLLAEPLFSMVKGIEPLIFVAVEAILFSGYAINRFFGNFSKAIEMDFGHLEIFVYKKKRR